MLHLERASRAIINQLAGRSVYIYQPRKQNQPESRSPLRVFMKRLSEILFYKYFIANPKMLL